VPSFRHLPVVDMPPSGMVARLDGGSGRSRLEGDAGEPVLIIDMKWMLYARFGKQADVFALWS